MSCGDMAGDNRFDVIAKAKQAMLDGTNIETSEDEMKVLDNILFRCWQMGWLNMYDDSKPKTGEWIKAIGMMPPEFHGHHCCSECGNFANMEPPFGNREDLSNYCSNCGARMKGSAE